MSFFENGRKNIYGDPENLDHFSHKGAWLKNELVNMHFSEFFFKEQPNIYCIVS